MGVKSLWSLLTPVGRPVLLETVEGKALAIDSSIWIYQFQATMRDKDGRALVNAHVLGFLRRICKLLFYGIKPVFVFDGGAPALKRSTISERKRKKAGAAASHVKLAERLLAAQMRREALNHAQAPHASTSKGKSKAPSGPVLIDDDAVYLEDIDNTVPKTPSKRAGKEEATPGPSPSSSSKKKSHFHDHDPFHLPDVNLEEAVAAATRSTTAPDPRLATEEELRAFIEDMRPEDFDVTSPAFRELPTEVQYEIVGDLRLKSRQTSYKRLQGMLQKAHTPLDFSRQQIKNLKQRNLLTQQLLMTTDSIGKAHLAIPVRIASERNKEYVLMKNEGEGGGWILGIRDEGTQEKPIVIDQDSDKEHQDDNEDSEMEMEEVNIPAAAVPDPDLRGYRRGLALSAIDERALRTNQNARPSKPIQRREKTKPLFDFDDEENGERMRNVQDDIHGDPELAFAIQESFDHGDPSRHVDTSPLVETRSPAATNARPSAASSTHPTTPPRRSSSSKQANLDSDDEDIYASPTRLETALSFANARPLRRPNISPQASMFGKPALLTVPHSTSPMSSQVQTAPKSDSDDDMEEVLPALPVTYSPIQLFHSNKEPSVSPSRAHLSTVSVPQLDSDDDMEEVHPSLDTGQIDMSTGRQEMTFVRSQSLSSLQGASPAKLYSLTSQSPLTRRGSSSAMELTVHGDELPAAQALNPIHQLNSPADQIGNRLDSDDEDGLLTDWSRSPSPMVGSSSNKAVVPRKSSASDETWDAAQEMDPRVEEGEFVRFMSQVKGRDLDDVRAEIDEEIKSLNQQRKAAMRDSEDITQQMISQIMLMLRLFGIPYITAPMEAEAQCAELVSLGLVEGIITDDSDVFLFGGLRVFKNMFNQSKTVECFFLSDLGRELGLDRDTLVRLAYLLGSDYVEGLPGVGPVVAMELLKEFPGEDGLHKFKDWWLKVQTGKDKPDDNKSKFRKSFKKKFKDLYLPNEWPNPAVRDAYYHPTVDNSDEPFKWGLPDLDGLRDFLREELGWHQTKVDELLLPVIQKIGKHGQAAAMNKQGNLNEFFDVSAGSGTYAPRKRQAYSSKRLQQVVSEFRNEKTKLKTGPSDISENSGEGGNETDTEKGLDKKRRKTEKIGKAQAESGQPTRKTAGRGRRKGRSRDTRAGKITEMVDNEGDEDEYVGDSGDAVGFAPQLRPRPKRKLTKAHYGEAESESETIDGHHKG